MNEFLTLMDLKNRMEPGDAAIAGIAEVIASENDIIQDIPWTRGNLLTGDVNFTRTTKPQGQKRKINQGIRSSVSKTTPNTDTCVEFASRSEVDKRKLKNFTNGSAEANRYLLSESKAHIATLGEMLIEDIMYGDDPEGIKGFVSRYNALSGQTGEQVFDCGGTGNDLTSIWVVRWDPDEVTGIYPKYSKAGLDMESSEELVKDKDGLEFRAIVSDFYWLAGLKVRDWRYVTRVANIKMSDLMTDAAMLNKIMDLMIYAKNKVYHPYNGRTVFYVNPLLYSAIEVAAKNKTNMALGYRDIEGRMSLVTYSGIPIRKNDSQVKPEKKVA